MHTTPRGLRTLLLTLPFLLATPWAVAGPVTLDFETEDDLVTPLVNGQDLSTPPEFGYIVRISSTPGGEDAGPAIFDSSFDGPNREGPDADLIVGLGNIVILQERSSDEQAVPGIFDVPDDELEGGILNFNFLVPVEAISVDLIDINGGSKSLVVLIDAAGNDRTYHVDNKWTHDITVSGPSGYKTLDLTTLADQPGEPIDGGPFLATATEEPGFDLQGVVRISIMFGGSGAMDNLVFVPPAGTCFFDGDCDDGNPCTGVETCSALVCQPGTPVTCKDDGIFCNGPELCDPADGQCGSGTPPCPDDCCEKSDVCIPQGGCCDDGDCDNTDPCTRTEFCDAKGACQVRTVIQDCNDNGAEDLCDIDRGTSQDCDGSSVPDECEIDCNGNGFHDSCDLATGVSEDCNGNGLPDECDIAACTGDPACDDCNLNGIPDGCDIEFGGWVDDDPADGVPDACVDPGPGGGNWTDDIWNLFNLNPKDPYPDNVNGVNDLHVTIDGVEVFVDETIEIQTLRLDNGGTLLVTQCLVGDFSTAALGGILNKGNLLVGGDRHVNAEGGDVTLGPGGTYAGVPVTCATQCPAGQSCATLSARDLFLTAGECASLRNGADMVVDQSMSVDLSGDLLLIGNPFFGCPAGTGAQARGINIPPKFRVIGPATGSTQDVKLDGVVETSNTSGSVAATASGGADGDAGTTFEYGLRMSGDFVNHSIAPSLFDWATGYLGTTGTVQQFEVAGIDFGPREEGFWTAADTLHDHGPHSNFAIGTLEVLPGSHLTFINEFANTVSAGPCQEAFYVRRLVLHDGAQLTLDNVRVYYDTLEVIGAGAPGDLIETIGCGGLHGLCNAQAPESDSVAKNRFISVTTGIPGRQQAIRVTFESLPAPFDLLNGASMWVGQPAAVNESANAVTPKPGGKSFWGSPLQCTPHFADWSVFGTVQVYHEAIVPGGSYPVQVVDQSCAAGGEAEFSPPLGVHMARFGDVVGVCGLDVCTPPDGNIDISDLYAVIHAFASTPGAVKKVRADLEPARPDLIVNITDALSVVQAFAGVRFPFPPPPSPCGK